MEYNSIQQVLIIYLMLQFAIIYCVILNILVRVYKLLENRTQLCSSIYTQHLAQCRYVFLERMK